MIDPDRLARLLDDHAAALELFAAQWTESAPDVVQEAFLRLAAQSPVPDRVLAWLYRVVRNGAISAVRSESRRSKHERNAGQRARSWFVHDPANPIDGEEAAAALSELPETWREVVVARIWGGLSFEEIGELIDASSSTAHRRYEAAIEKLRLRLSEPCETNCQTTGT